MDFDFPGASVHQIDALCFVCTQRVMTLFGDRHYSVTMFYIIPINQLKFDIQFIAIVEKI